MQNARGSQAAPAFCIGAGNIPGGATGHYAGMFGTATADSALGFSTNSTERLRIHSGSGALPGGVETSGSLSVGTLGNVIGHITIGHNISTETKWFS